MSDKPRYIKVLQGSPRIGFYSNSRYFIVVCGQKCGQSLPVRGGLFSVSLFSQSVQSFFAAYPEAHDCR
jgi:hypothetical protein